MSRPVIDLVTRMDPGGHALAWACSNCRRVYSDREIAARCCVCIDCGFFGPKTGSAGDRCVACQDAWRARCRAADEAKDATAIAAAPTIRESEVGARRVFWKEEMGYGHDGYFESVACLREWCKQDGCEVPKRVWLCQLRPLSIKASEFLGDLVAAQDMGDDLVDMLDPDAVRTLQSLLDAWTASYAGQLSNWFPSETAVILD